MKIKIIHDPKEAKGIAVIIDVFRAFTVEPYLINNGTKKLIAIGDKEAAYELKENNKDIILIGERGGIKLPGFDFGNSPSQIENIDFSGKTVVHTTSCGTQGIVNAANAEEIITGSLVNARTIVKYIKSSKIDDVSLVSIARPGEEPFEEDELCAKYIKCLYEGKYIDMKEEIKKLKESRGLRFFDKLMQADFPERDFYLCTELDKFDFVLKANRSADGLINMEKVTVASE